MKRYVRSNNDPWSQTKLIDTKLPQSVKYFMSLDTPDLSYHAIKSACDAFWADYDKFPTNNGWISDSIKYDTDKGTFYRNKRR